MTASKIIDEIQNWFCKVGSAEFELPDGHFGRPYDCFFCLKSIYMEENKLFIELLNDLAVNTEFESPILFTFQGSTQIRFNDNCMEIYDFQSLVFQRQDTISPYSERLDGKKITQPETYIDEYDEGVVRFIPYKDPINPKFRL